MSRFFYFDHLPRGQAEMGPDTIMSVSSIPNIRTGWTPAHPRSPIMDNRRFDEGILEHCPSQQFSRAAPSRECDVRP